MPLDPDLEAWLRLSLLDGLGPQALRKLLVARGSPRDILASGARDLATVVPGKLVSAIRDGGASDEALDKVDKWLADPTNHVITLADSEYPRALLEIADPPPLLYVKGRLDLLNRPGFAIVGSRNAIAQGTGNAEAFANTLSDAGLTIVSGLALGVDAAAHRGGLAGAASTIAVVGTGLDMVYPARNRELAHRIAKQGVLISEFPPGTPAVASSFPRRNRRKMAVTPDIQGMTARDVMTSHTITITSDTLAVEALALLEQRKITSVVVIDADRRVEGVLHLHDLWRTEMV